MNNMLKDLVKKHFNLVDAPVEDKVELSEEAVVEQTFGEIKTADGELTLTYEGEEFTVGTEIFVITADGNVPAPDGEHELEGGIKIETEGGVITSIERGEEELPEIADETTAGMYPKEEMAEEETVMEVGVEEAIVSAIAEVIAPMIDEMKKEIEEMKSKFAATEKKVETFGLQPAAERTKAEIKNRNTAKTNVDYNPLNEDKRLQFERLLKTRNKK
jgi:hypothetical protein